jgi:hypothetical protein
MPEFILRLLNDPSWLKFIGDMGFITIYLEFDNKISSSATALAARSSRSEMRLINFNLARSKRRC